MTQFIQAQPITIHELEKKLTYERYSDQALSVFLNSMAHLEEIPDIYEYVPGSIIAWSFIDGGFLLNKTFFIDQEEIREIEAIPKDSVFLAKLNSYVPEQSRFIYRRELWTLPVVKQGLNQTFLIRANVRSYNPRPYEPSSDILNYQLEYVTKNFVEFQLVRFKEVNSGIWIEVD